MQNPLHPGSLCFTASLRPRSPGSEVLLTVQAFALHTPADTVIGCCPVHRHRDAQWLPPLTVSLIHLPPLPAQRRSSLPAHLATRGSQWRGSPSSLLLLSLALAQALSLSAPGTA